MRHVRTRDRIDASCSNRHVCSISQERATGHLRCTPPQLGHLIIEACVIAFSERPGCLPRCLAPGPGSSLDGDATRLASPGHLPVTGWRHKPTRLTRPGGWPQGSWLASAVYLAPGVMKLPKVSGAAAVRHSTKSWIITGSHETRTASAVWGSSQAPVVPLAIGAFLFKPASPTFPRR
jgi:hypothetical protein